jgi:hypothetical protein
LKSYFKENPGTPFILGFIILLVSAAVLLVAGKSDEANATAVYAFYSIVLGIIIQVVFIIREERKHFRSSRGKPSGPS